MNLNEILKEWQQPYTRQYDYRLKRGEVPNKDFQTWQKYLSEDQIQASIDGFSTYLRATLIDAEINPETRTISNKSILLTDQLYLEGQQQPLNPQDCYPFLGSHPENKYEMLLNSLRNDSLKFSKLTTSKAGDTVIIKSGY